MTEPGMFAKDVMLFITALAAMEGVPNVDTRDCTSILPMWNVLFSIPEGRPIRSILRTIMPFHSNLKSLSTCISSFLLHTTTSMIVAPTTRLRRDAIPAPAVPSPKM